MKNLDPKIRVAEALKVAGGNQAALGRMVGISRASVNAWVTGRREFLPALQAYRFISETGCRVGDNGSIL